MKKTILVTGAAVRIGREIALTFAKDGWNIIIHCNSSTEKAEALAKEIEENFDSSAKVVQANLDKDDHVERMIDEVKSCFCLLYTSPSPRDGLLSRMPSSA